jgi:LuxR family glucitol operon transcriptional activator
VASYQRVALFILFDSLERDLINNIRVFSAEGLNLTAEEATKARSAISRQLSNGLDAGSPLDQLHGLDLGDKFGVLLRHKEAMDQGSRDYFLGLSKAIGKVIAVRNAIMHGRPLTIEEYSVGFAFAQDLLGKRVRWPVLASAYSEYTASPERFVSKAVAMIDGPPDYGVLNNLPVPDYDDTGFLPRPDLERLLKKRLLGRYPVITVLGDGGNGKTALALQTLYGLVETNDHPFELIIWFSAKASALSAEGVTEIADAVTASSAIIESIAEFEPGLGSPMERLRRLLETNKVLLSIDNLETITGGLIQELIEDVPGDSKILLTSRVPVGGDLPVNVLEFTDVEAIRYLRRLIEAHGVTTLKSLEDGVIKSFSARLNNKPLLLKWFVLGVKSGLDPNKITANPKEALRFCLENVVDKLSPAAKAVSVVLATVPDKAPPAVVRAVSNLTTLHVEEGLGELSRFGLVDVSDISGYDREFRLRNFVRSYITRIVEPSPAATTTIRQRYLRIEAEYEQEKLRSTHNIYDVRTFIVRSKSEAVASKSLRHASKLAVIGEVDTVEDIISEHKSTNPAYFEVYRVEAFAAFNWSDIPRAVAAYEAALEFGRDQPQLHFFFAGMLMRAGYHERASEHFAEASRLDPLASSVLREAARNEMRLYNFEKAKDYLTLCEALPSRAQKDAIILLDLRIQLYVRSMEHAISNGDFEHGSTAAGELLSYLECVNQRLFDDTIYQHIRDALSLIAILRRDGRNDNSTIDGLSQWIRENASLDAQLRRNTTPSGKSIGFLKQKGRKPTFGFLVDGNQVETFIAAGNVDPEIWSWLNQDGAVEYEVTRLASGKTTAQALNIIRS